MSSHIPDDEQQFRLVFPGNILPGSDVDIAIAGLARLLKTTPDSAKKLVSGKRRYVKRAFIYEKADELRERVLQLGVECELKLVDENVSSSKAKKKKSNKPFPKPVNIAMQPAKPDQTSDQDQSSDKEKSYSEAMAEFQQHAIKNRVEETVTVELDIAALSFNAENGQDKKSAALESIKRRLSQFVGENIDAYMPKFDKFQQGGTSHFVFTWHWPAFLVPFFWAIYRKLWGWSVIIFISSIFWPLTNILWGVAANYIYYRHCMQKIKAIRKNDHASDIDEKLREEGGTSTLALSAALLAILLLMYGVYWTGKLSPVFSTLRNL